MEGFFRNGSSAVDLNPKLCVITVTLKNEKHFKKSSLKKNKNTQKQKQIKNHPDLRTMRTSSKRIK